VADGALRGLPPISSVCYARYIRSAGWKDGEMAERVRRCESCNGTGRQIVADKKGNVTERPCAACGGSGSIYIGNI